MSDDALIHVAILKPDLVQAVLDGRKTVESRLTVQPRPPLGVIEAGERLFLKVSSGPFRATAVASAVREYRDLDPAGVRGLHAEWNDRVLGPTAYWQAKAGSRFAVMVTLTRVEACEVGPAYRIEHMKAWYALPDAASPWHERVITAGAIRNGYLAVPKTVEIAAGEPFVLTLPDGEVVETPLAEGRRLQWRGWGTWYRAQQALPGDRVVMLHQRDGSYGVRLIRSTPH